MIVSMIELLCYLGRAGVVVEKQLVLLDLLSRNSADAVAFGESTLDVVDQGQQPEHFAEPHVVLNEGQRQTRRLVLHNQTESSNIHRVARRISFRACRNRFRIRSPDSPTPLLVNDAN